MNFLATLGHAANYLGASLQKDEVFIMNAETYEQMFQYARPIRLQVHEANKIMQHPLEDGSLISEHLVKEPVHIEISFIFIDGYKNTQEQFRNAFKKGTLFTIQTKARIYENMVLKSMPHEEDPEYMNVLQARLNFEEVFFVTPQYSKLTPAQIADTKDSSALQRGIQQGSTLSATEMKKASALYKNANILSPSRL